MEIQTGALVIVLAYMVGMMIIGYVVGKNDYQCASLDFHRVPP